MERYFTINEICASIQVTRRTVARWIKEGHLKASRLGGRRLWRIREKDLGRFLHGN